MAWIISCRFPRIQSYKEAVKVWHQAVIFPGSPLGPRGLVDRRKKHLAIERTEAEDIVLRLHQHPVVTWHKDNSLTICPYPSRSTTKFGNYCTPPEMYVGYSSVSISGLHYKIKGKLTFRQRDGKWKVADRSQITPWSVPVVNRERAKQALREVGYEEFRLWFKVYVQMTSPPDGRARWIDNASLVTMLRDRSKWRELVSRFVHSWNRPDQVLHEIRQAIYHECGCIDRKSVPFLG